MIVGFDSFQYDCEQKILTKDGQIVPLSEKPAQLLSLFITEADKIHSKSDILETVWPDRIVTEQVVFQNISYLRALFGDKAIKTFSKKGYQWQLPLTIITQGKSANFENKTISGPDLVNQSTQVFISSESNGEPALTAHSMISKQVARKKLLKPTIALIVVLLIAVTLVFLSDTNAPINQGKSLPTTGVVHTVKQGRFTALHNTPTSTIDAQTLFDSPFSVWQKNNTSETRWLVAIKHYFVNDKLAVRFHIQGAQRGWHDYMLANDENDAQNKLAQLLSLLASTRYFEVGSDHTALAELTVLIDKNPEHAQLHTQQIKLLFKLNELDKANALADRQLSSESNRFRTGLLHLLKAQINLWNKHNSAASDSADKAVTVFSELKHGVLEASALVELSWVHFANNELRQGMQLLNQAASKARSNNEPLLEVTARLNQSFMAAKAGEVELSYTQKSLAEELLRLHKLADEHQVRVLNTAVWMAKSVDEKTALSQHILNLPFSPQYEIYYYVAAENVRQRHIHEHQWQQALATVKPWQRQSFQLLSTAHIKFAQSEWKAGVEYAKNAYTQAQANHHIIDALDAALLLIQQQGNPNVSIDVSEYQAFINKNATNRWRDQNREAIKQLSNH